MAFCWETRYFTDNFQIINKITIKKLIIMFREETTSDLAGFHEGHLSRSNGNLEMLRSPVA